MTSDNSTPDWEQYASWNKLYVWHAFTQMRDYKPLIIESADGCILKDIEGNELIDGGAQDVEGEVVRHERLGGMLSFYERAA